MQWSSSLTGFSMTLQWHAANGRCRTQCHALTCMWHGSSVSNPVQLSLPTCAVDEGVQTL